MQQDEKIENLDDRVAVLEKTVEFLAKSKEIVEQENADLRKQLKEKEQEAKQIVLT